MSFNPKVSIVIPVYNGSNYLKEAIDSALAQTYKNIEVIVVNDGSNDNGATEKIALSYGDRIRYFSKPNGGVATALNLGIEKMTGEYFSWLSHDDLYMTNKIESQINLLASLSNIDNVIIFSNYNFVGTNGEYVSDSNLQNLKYNDFLLNLLEDYPVNGCTCLIPKYSFYDVGVFDYKLRITQDYDWWYRAYKNGFSFLYLNEVTVSSRQHDGQDSKNLSPLHLDEVNQLYINYVKSLSLYDLSLQSHFIDFKSWLKSIEASLSHRGLIKAANYVKELINNYVAVKPRILVVAMFFSIHVRRWITNLLNSNFEVHCFPSMDWGDNVVSIFPPEIINSKQFILHGFKGLNDEVVFPYLYHETVDKSDDVVEKFVNVVVSVKPHMIHALEMQQAGYLVQKAHSIMGGYFPKWLYTNYGSDLYVCPKLSKHSSSVTSVLKSASFYSAECKRDVYLANKYGFSGVVVGTVCNVGGFDLNALRALRSNIPTSKRNVIALKGYQHEYGRALVALKALHLCKDLLLEKNMEIHIYSAQASPSVHIAAELLTKDTGIITKIIPYTLDNNEIIKVHSLARISIGLSISDGISISLLEAMSMGSFPIQSYTAAADEWIVNGETGYIVDPEDPVELSKLLSMSLINDELVDSAAEINIRTIEQRLDWPVVNKQIIDMYNKCILVSSIVQNETCSLNVVNIGDNDIYGKRFNNHYLTKYLRNRLIDASELVWHKYSSESYTQEIASVLPNRRDINEYCNQLNRYYDSHATNNVFSYHLLFEENFLQASVVHYHLIHNHFFNIKDLPILTNLKPTVWTIHDPWVLTGHCIHFFDCDKWISGCGSCPNLNSDFKVDNDTTALNWELKKVYISSAKFDVIVASDWMKDLIQRSPLFEGKKVHLIPFGLDLNIFNVRDKYSVRKKLNIKKDNFVIALRAHDWELKGISFIKKALDMLSFKNISIITVHHKGLFDSYKGKYEIIDLGWVDNDSDIVDFYNSADVFLMPSLAESFGVSAMESIACGTPVISFDNTAVSEVICPPLGGIVVSKGNVNELTDALVRLINNPSLLLQLSISARKLAEEKFDKDLYVSKVLDVYHEVISKFESSEQVNKVIDSQLKIKLTDSNIYKAVDAQLVSNNHNSSELEQIKNSRTYILAMRMKNNKCIRGAYFYLFRPLYRMLRKIKHSV